MRRSWGCRGHLHWGSSAGILELLPNLGPILAIIPAIIIALTQGSTHFALSNGVFTLIVIGFYVAVQQIEDVVVVPRLMSRAVKLHPLVVILGFFVGALSFGILGAILATPVIASVKEIVRYLYLKIRGLPVEVELPAQRSTLSDFTADPDQPPQEEAPAVEEQSETSKQEQADAKT